MHRWTCPSCIRPTSTSTTTQALEVIVREFASLDVRLAGQQVSRRLQQRQQQQPTTCQQRRFHALSTAAAARPCPYQQRYARAFGTATGPMRQDTNGQVTVDKNEGESSTIVKSTSKWRRKKERKLAESGASQVAEAEAAAKVAVVDRLPRSHQGKDKKLTKGGKVWFEAKEAPILSEEAMEAKEEEKREKKRLRRERQKAHWVALEAETEWTEADMEQVRDGSMEKRKSTVTPETAEKEAARKRRMRERAASTEKKPKGPESTRPPKEGWQIQKAALEEKFGEEKWLPRKRISPDALDLIRSMHRQQPETYTTEVLAGHFKVSPENIRRILKSKWAPDEETAEDRRKRWEKRGEKKWREMVEQGIRPPKKWREMGVGSVGKGETPLWKRHNGGGAGERWIEHPELDNFGAPAVEEGEASIGDRIV